MLDVITNAGSEQPVPRRTVPPDEVLFGRSVAAAELVARLYAVAGTDLPVVLQGEAGTGKQLVGRWIHERSAFASQHFVRASCPFVRSADECHIEVDDAETAAKGSLLQQLRRVGGGTLFLDDVENLALTTQALLSRLMQDMLHSAAAGEASSAPRFRMISATRGDLKQEMATRLRPEFFHTISTFTARLAPLRERVHELPQLAAYFIGMHSRDLGLERAPLAAATIDVLAEYEWPGNFHELEQMLISYVLTGSQDLLVEKVQALRRSPEIDAALEATSQLPAPGMPQEGAVVRKRSRAVSHPRRNAQGESIDDEAILRALRENRWNRRQAAMRLQMSYRSLLNRLKKIDTSGKPHPGLRWAANRANS